MCVCVCVCVCVSVCLCLSLCVACCSECGGHLWVEHVVYGLQKEGSINFVLVFCVLVFNCYLIVFDLAPNFFNGEEVVEEGDAGVFPRTGSLLFIPQVYRGGG